MKTRTFATIGAALIVGFLSGSLNASTPDVKAPHQCTVMATVAEKAFVTYENYATSLELRATRGQADYAGHDAEVARLRGELDDDLGPAYHEAKAACLGGVS